MGLVSFLSGGANLIYSMMLFLSLAFRACMYMYIRHRHPSPHTPSTPRRASTQMMNSEYVLCRHEFNVSFYQKKYKWNWPFGLVSLCSMFQAMAGSTYGVKLIHQITMSFTYYPRSCFFFLFFSFSFFNGKFILRDFTLKEEKKKEKGKKNYLGTLPFYLSPPICINKIAQGCS